MDRYYEELKQEVIELKSIILSGALNPVSQKPTYLKADAAAEFLSTTKNALHVMVYKDQIPYIKKLGKLYFLQSDLVEWLESGRVNLNQTSPEDILISKNKKRS
ncbi:helix-turn-helix domain-containing protein [Pedobacter sp. Leaf170]|uniref:helix-turn-helix domain-containing protein n=1 Tax=Pedobacter sp. Leaf170 TaxID=2876558 RepID=UPI001E3EADC2|nr:helix-turn-helix domain-containing protein [Pedobacter sp. Leaf170]